MRQVDTYSAERASFAERLGRLAGGTTWREPLEGNGTNSDPAGFARAGGCVGYG